DCAVEAHFELTAPELELTPQATKTFHFSWDDLEIETEYRLLEDPDGSSVYTEVASIAADATSYDLVVSLSGRINARYILQACYDEFCTESADSAPVYVDDS